MCVCTVGFFIFFYQFICLNFTFFVLYFLKCCMLDFAFLSSLIWINNNHSIFVILCLLLFMNLLIFCGLHKYVNEKVRILLLPFVFLMVQQKLGSK